MRTAETAEQSNIISVSWSDHLVFGQGDGRLSTIEAVNRRMRCWKQDLNSEILYWRCTRDRIRGRFYEGSGHQHFFRAGKSDVDWDDFEVIPEIAHTQGMQVFLYVTLFDEGWPLLPKKIREYSYHNRMHCQHVSWQSDFSRANPRYAMVDRTLRKHQCIGRLQPAASHAHSQQQISACSYGDALLDFR